MFFLWDRIRLEYNDESGVRLDKFPFSEISWEEDLLIEMVSKRLKHFSGGQLIDGQQLCDDLVEFEARLREFVRIVSKSPGELMRLLDVLIREYDVKYAAQMESPPLSNRDFEDAINSYVKNIVWTIYDRKYLSQILRLDMQRFTNKDVQSKFKISDQSARNWIRNWVNCGAVRQSGTTAGDSETIGKPANIYSISDPRLSLMMDRNLYDREALIVEVPVSEDE